VKAEIIAVGTELLLGEITNTTTPYVARELAQLGADVYHQSVVGDNQARLTQALKLADSRSDLVVLTGGLGPTKDDLTKQTLAQYLNEPLVIDQPAMTQIEAFYQQRQRQMTANNRVQAMLPAHATPLANPAGMAVGAFYQAPDHAYLLLPGPPHELIAMFQKSVRPVLQAYCHADHVLVSRVLRFHGIGESQLVTTLADLIDQQTNPTIAPYAKPHEVTLRLTATATATATAEQLLAATTAQILDLVGDYYYGEGETNSLAQVVVAQLKQQQLTITAAESLTAGMFQSTLADVPGASTIFNGGFVTYSLAEKAHLLDIPTADLEAHGVVSAETAIAMASHSKQILNAAIGMGFTGVAGPDELEGNPAGTVYIGVALPNQAPFAKCYHFSGNRESVREQAVLMGLDLLYHQLKPVEK
jgi:nicotinamide-nucleotide amidase